MKKHIFLTSIIFAFIAEIIMLVIFAVKKTETRQDAVIANEIVHSVMENWENIGNYKDSTGASYVVAGKDGKVLYKTKTGLVKA